MTKRLRVGRGSAKRQTTKTAQPTKHELCEKTVTFDHEGQKLFGLVKSISGVEAMIDLALPDDQGVLHTVGSEVAVAMKDFDTDSSAVMSERMRKVKAWEASLALEFPDGKAPTPRFAGDGTEGPIIDYLDVRFDGFLSTFMGTTPEDREGDYVEPSAFDQTLVQFRKNPVMLTDHTNRVAMLAGSFEKIGTNERGLAVSGLLSNSPGVIDTRFKVAEGHLKSLSMGGLFFYKDDYRGIEVVDLFEGSLTPVPANQDALFQVRSLTVVDAAKAMKLFHR